LGERGELRGAAGEGGDGGGNLVPDGGDGGAVLGGAGETQPRGPVGASLVRQAEGEGDLGDDVRAHPAPTVAEAVVQGAARQPPLVLRHPAGGATLGDAPADLGERRLAGSRAEGAQVCGDGVEAGGRRTPVDGVGDGAGHVSPGSGVGVMLAAGGGAGGCLPSPTAEGAAP